MVPWLFEYEYGNHFVYSLYQDKNVFCFLLLFWIDYLKIIRSKHGCIQHSLGCPLGTILCLSIYLVSLFILLTFLITHSYPETHEPFKSGPHRCHPIVLLYIYVNIYV